MTRRGLGPWPEGRWGPGSEGAGLWPRGALGPCPEGRWGRGGIAVDCRLELLDGKTLTEATFTLHRAA